MQPTQHTVWPYNTAEKENDGNQYDFWEFGHEKAVKEKENILQCGKRRDQHTEFTTALVSPLLPPLSFVIHD